jgi:hypothetical protein
MGRYFICVVAPQLLENYEIGVRAGKWGVTRRHHRRIAAAAAGDYIVFVVAGEVRSIHRIIRGPYKDSSVVWPPYEGDPFPYRVDIGAAEESGSVSLRELAPGIRYLREGIGRRLMGANGVFNPHVTPEEGLLIRESLRGAPAEPEDQEILHLPPRIIELEGSRWLPSLLDQLAALSNLSAHAGFTDPFAEAGELRQGIVSRVYADRQRTPTLAVLPVDREPDSAVIAALHGLSALKQAPDAPRSVRGIIFVPEREPIIGSLVRGLANLQAVSFRAEISLRN